MKDYELYVSNDSDDWGEPVSQGSFTNSFAPTTVSFNEPKEGRYFKLVCLSEVNGNIWASAAEFSIQGCYASSLSEENVQFADVKAFPVPTDGMFTMYLPSMGAGKYSIHSSNGVLLQQGLIDNSIGKEHSFDLNPYPSGVYVVRVVTNSGKIFRSKIILAK